MIGYKELCPIGTNVRIIAPIGSDHEGWTVMPVARDKSQMFIPKGYELVEGIGTVTGYELAESFVDKVKVIERENPVYVEELIQCTLNIDWWLKEEACEN